MSKRSKFVFLTWVGSNVSVMKKAKMSTDKLLMKEIIQVRVPVTPHIICISLSLSYPPNSLLISYLPSLFSCLTSLSCFCSLFLIPFLSSSPLPMDTPFHLSSFLLPFSPIFFSCPCLSLSCSLLISRSPPSLAPFLNPPPLLLPPPPFPLPPLPLPSDPA